MRLMMPEVERSHAHRKLHSIDFIERRRMCEKVKREGGKKRNTDLITDCWPESLCSVSVEVIVASAFVVVRPLIRILTVRLLQESPVSMCNCYPYRLEKFPDHTMSSLSPCLLIC